MIYDIFSIYDGQLFLVPSWVTTTTIICLSHDPTRATRSDFQRGVILNTDVKTLPLQQVRTVMINYLVGWGNIVVDRDRPVNFLIVLTVY